MAAVSALFVGGGLLALALIIMMYRETATAARLGLILVLAILTSAGSVLYATSRHSGMGTLLSRGFPKPFHFHWRAFENDVPPHRDINFAYFGANTMVHLGAMSLIGALLLRPRRRPENHTMRGSMVLFRILLGVLFLILGVIGGFIPILQGWIFILLGLLVLFPKARFTEKVLHKAEPKLPRVVAFLRRMGIGTQE